MNSIIHTNHPENEPYNLCIHCTLLCKVLTQIRKLNPFFYFACKNKFFVIRRIFTKIVYHCRVFYMRKNKQNYILRQENIKYYYCCIFSMIYHMRHKNVRIYFYLWNKIKWDSPNQTQNIRAHVRSFVFFFLLFLFSWRKGHG